MNILSPFRDTIYIDSYDLVSGTSSDFYVNIADQLKQPNNYDQVVLLSATIPKSWYLIDSSNSTFILTENGVNHSVVIDTGNYNFSTLMTELQTQLNFSGSYTYTVSKSYQTGKYTITVSGNGGIQPSLTFTEDSPNFIFGFSDGVHNFSANVLTSDLVVNINRTNSVYVMSNMVGGNDSVLCNMVINSQAYSLITFQETCPAYTSRPFIRDSSNTFRFWILNSDYKPLDLNGQQVQLVLAVFKQDNSNLITLNEKKINTLLDE